MPLSAHEIEEALTERQQADKVLSQWSGSRKAYSTFHNELQEIYKVYAGQFDVVWPDKARTEALPKVLNTIQLASEDRARQVAAIKPSLICRPPKAGDKHRAASDKRERIYMDWFHRNRIYGRRTQSWAHDAMSGGLTVCGVWHDFLKPAEERFPVFRRYEPLNCYPDPIFTEGPYVDSMIVSYEEKIRTVEKRFGVKLEWSKRPEISNERCHVIEYHDDTYVTFVAKGIGRENYRPKDLPSETLLSERHGLGCTPVVIGTRPTMDGVYRGEFFGSLGVLNFANKLMTLMLDDAVRKVYSPTLSFDIENPEDFGPDAHLEATSEKARFEHVQAPNQPFSNQQFLRDLNGTMRAAALMPPSRSGDPDQSIISAAGISATQSQFVEDVKSIQRDILAPMFQAAIKVGCKLETTWTPDVEKTVGASGGGRYAETYVPSKDIEHYDEAEVRYGPGAGLDEINANVMMLQQWAGGNGVIARRTAMEASTLVEDPQREEKRLAMEQLDQAVFAGLIAAASQGQIDSFALAEIRRAVESDNVSLHDAIAAATPQAPLAAPQSTAPGALPEAPGLAGAAEGPQPSNMPNLTELLGA